MAKIALRAYNREIETVIDRGQIEEAIAHCKYILRFFPKHIETYRLLRSIESQRYSEAADILQRVLSVLPDDFIAQVGMSIIREDESNLDAAIFHMEHAHEIQPSNVAVQDELRRLYGRRDGVEPPRLRLTRGALVRLYAKGDLYRQAIAEIRAALSEDPNRFDLEVILARMYDMLGQKVEATDIASRLVAKLPYCMEANRILAEILPTTARAEDAKTYQMRVYALDPYLAYISTNAPTLNQVPDNAVTLDHLEFRPTLDSEEQPAWALNAGIDIPGEEDAAEATPEWLTPAPAVNQAAQPITEAPSQPAAPAAFEQASGISSEIPDWMQQSGWGASAQGVQETPIEENESAAPAEEMPDWLKGMAPQETASTSQLPENDVKDDWLDQMLPEAEPAQTQGFDFPLPADLFNETTDQAPATYEPTAGSDAFDESIPTWLTFPDEANAAPEPPIEPASSELPASGDEIQQPVEENPVDSLPVEFSQPIEEIESAPQDQTAVENEPVSPEQAVSLESSEPVGMDSHVTEPTAEVESEQVADLPQEAVAESSEAPQDQILDEAIQPAASEAPTPATVETVATPSAYFADEVPATVLAGNETSPDEITKPVKAVPAEPTAEAQPDWNDLDAAMAWLEGLAAKQGADQETLSTAAEDRPESPPEWVKQEQEQSLEEQPTAELTPPAAEDSQPIQAPELETSAFEPASDMPAEISTPPILESDLATPLTEGSIEDSTIEEIIPEIPELTVEPAVSETPVDETINPERPAASVEPAVSEALADEAIYPETPPVESLQVEEAVSQAPTPLEVEVPSDQQSAMSEEQTAAPLPSQQIPSFGEDMDTDAAFAWLESLAAQQGADEETLSTSKEEREAAQPAWTPEQFEQPRAIAGSTQPVESEVAESESSAPEIQAPVPDSTPETESEFIAPETLTSLAEAGPVPDDTPEPPVAETPPLAEEAIQPVAPGEWIQESEQLAVSEVAPQPSASPSTDLPEEEPLPAWLQEIDQPLPVTSTLVAPEGMEDLPDWLKGFETPSETPATQGVDEPGSVASWLKEQEIAASEAIAPVQKAPEQPVPAVPSAPISGPSETAPLKGYSTTDNPLIAQAQTDLQGSELEPAMEKYNAVIEQGQNIDAVIQDLVNASYHYPVEPALWQTLGDAYIQNDQIQDALDAYTKAEELLR